jgi:L-arabonate dehydrase
MQHRGRAVVFETMTTTRSTTRRSSTRIIAEELRAGLSRHGRGRQHWQKLLKPCATWCAFLMPACPARRNGGAHGTGGTLALVDGDWIELDVAGRRLHLDVDEAELARRRTAPAIGYQGLYVERVMRRYGRRPRFPRRQPRPPVPRETLRRRG